MVSASLANGRRPGDQCLSTRPVSLVNLATDLRGVTAIEYAFIAGLVAIVIVGAVTTLGTSVSSLFGSVVGGF